MVVFKPKIKITRNKSTKKRYIWYKNRKYQLSSSLSDAEIQRNLFFIIKKLLSRRKLTRKPSNNVLSNAKQPIITGSTSNVIDQAVIDKIKSFTESNNRNQLLLEAKKLDLPEDTIKTKLVHTIKYYEDTLKAVQLQEQETKQNVLLLEDKNEILSDEVKEKQITKDDYNKQIKELEDLRDQFLSEISSLKDNELQLTSNISNLKNELDDIKQDNQQLNTQVNQTKYDEFLIKVSEAAVKRLYKNVFKGTKPLSTNSGKKSKNDLLNEVIEEIPNTKYYIKLAIQNNNNKITTVWADQIIDNTPLTSTPIKMGTPMKFSLGKGLTGNHKGLYDFEIEKLMNKYSKYGFKGVFPVDKLSDILDDSDNKSMSFIMNTQPSTVPVGHWVAVYIDNNNLEYYDPLGFDPDKLFIKNIKPVLRQFVGDKQLQFKINRIRYQRWNSDTCGYHSMKFLVDRYHGKHFKEITGFDRFSDALDGEAKVRAFKKKILEFGFIKG